MGEKNWSQAYFTVLTLSFVLLLPCSFISAAAIGGPAEEVFRDMRLELPGITELYFWLGPVGILAVCHGALLVILALCVRRQRLYAVLIAGVVFASCMLYLLYASIALVMPFLSLMQNIGQE